MRGPGVANFDFTLAKSFPRSGSRRSVQFRTELFNAFNHPTSARDIGRDSSGFGHILSAANARIIQFGLKFYF